MSSAIWSIGTAVPDTRVSRRQALRFMRACHESEPDLGRRLDYIYRRSRIDCRHSCCPEFARPPGSGEARGEDGAADSYLFGEPRLECRMNRFEAAVVPLALEASTRALAKLKGFSLEEVTHLIAVTCTGFFAPGPEVALAEKLGLRSDIQRLQIGFMGCQAALQGLQVADAICRSDCGAVVLMVCVELCTIHFHRQSTPENLVVNSLFADGAAAAVVSSRQLAVTQRFTICDFYSQVMPNSSHLISWRIGETSFRMGLDPGTPKAVREYLPDFVDSLLSKAGWRRADVAGWAIHPGGRAILDTAEKCLNLSHEQLAPSWEVLRCFGNMSSPTILFVLDRTEAPQGLALSFGPGLSMEGVSWRRGS